MADKITAVTFDIDGTLYSVKKFRFRQILMMLPFIDVIKDLQAIRESIRGNEYPDIKAVQIQMFADKRNITVSQAESILQRVVYQRWIESLKKVRLFSGVKKVLKTLSAKNISLGLISDYPVEPKIAALDLSDIKFDVMVSAEEVGALKPHAKSFKVAAEKLGVATKNILHIGDRQDCDVAGARQAGMRTGLFFQKKPPQNVRADFIFSNWKDLIKIIEEKIGFEKIGDD
jgi:HAD superfamily hydrolase (TIGR01509 family)